MSITVYWACFDKEWLRAKEPENIIKKVLKEDKYKEVGLNMCPGFRNYFNNTYSIQSLYDYEFYIKDGDVFSDLYDQTFFNDHVVTRSIENKCFSFTNKWIFFTENDSLEMSISGPTLEDSNIAKDSIYIPGTFDIGKWFRSIDIAFFLRENINKIKIKEDDSLGYIKFNTNQKIILKQFMMNETILNYLESTLNSKFNRNTRLRSFDEYYSIFKNKKRIIKEIKKTLIN